MLFSILIVRWVFGLRADGSQALELSTDISQPLLAWFNRSLNAIGSGEGGSEPRAKASFELIECTCTTVGGWFDQTSGQADEGLSAVVLCALHGPLWGVGLLAMVPHDALRWAHGLSPGADPEQVFTAQADSLLVSLVEAATAGLGDSPVFGDVRFEEDVFAACIAGTHAPLDTLLVQARIQLPCSEAPVQARLCLLLELKGIDALGSNRS